MTRVQLNCTHCGKRLSRKTARQIEGVVMCSTCMFAPRKSGEARSAETERLGPQDENAVPAGHSPKPEDLMTNPKHPVSQELADYAREASKALTTLSGGGSEMFKRIGDDFYADPALCIQRTQEKILHRAKFSRPIPTAPQSRDGLVERLEAVSTRMPGHVVAGEIWDIAQALRTASGEATEPSEEGITS